MATQIPIPMQIYIANVPFDDTKQTKLRPALVITHKGLVTSVFKITSKHSNKSNAIRRFYYPIQKWRTAGLNRPSYVDVHNVYDLENIELHNVIGSLSQYDIHGPKIFIRSLHN